MRYVWIAALTAVAFFVTGIGCAAWAYFKPVTGEVEGYNMVGWVVLAAASMVLALLAGAAACVLYLVNGLPH